MPRHYFSPQFYQSAVPFSHYFEHRNIRYTAGIMGQRPDTGELVSESGSPPCDAMISNLPILLDEQWLILRGLLRTSGYLTDYRLTTGTSRPSTTYTRGACMIRIRPAPRFGCRACRWAPECKLKQ